MPLLPTLGCLLTCLQMDIRRILPAYMGIKTKGPSLIRVVDHVIPVRCVRR